MEEEEAHEFFHTCDNFSVDDLLVDFSNDDDEDNHVVVVVDDSNTTTTITDGSNFSSADLPIFNGGDVHDDTSFSGDLCVPCDDLAELEWLSNFVEESFSTEDINQLQLKSGFKTRPDSESGSGNPENSNSNSPIFTTDVSVPGKARSKRSRAVTCNWASSGILMNSVYENPFIGEPVLSPPLSMAHLGKKQRWQRDNCSPEFGGEVRRCFHCDTDKTPQWRTGPMGPKTLCNACGVRYKSGRLVPEYRPAASPTFVMTKHSNSHRKIMELRRKKEMSRLHVSSDGGDYLIHHNVGPDFREVTGFNPF